MGQWLIGFGLALDIAGALLMFRYGVPAYTQREKAGESGLLLEGTDEEVKRDARRADRIAKVGAGLLALGFALQLAGLVAD